MKKFFLFASAALVLASCSSEAEEAVIKPNETPEEEVLELTEIKLGGGAPTASAETRAAVVMTQWNNTEVGIFGVNENLGLEAEDNKWNDTPGKNSMNVTSEKAVILLNQKAKIESSSLNKVKLLDDEGNDATFYFPRGNTKDYGYTFLGYYPYSNNIVTTETSISVSGEFDGSQDIMAGKAASATPVGDQIGYNAKYIRDWRTNQNQPEGYPAIDIPFDHMTSRLDIIFKKGDSYLTDMCNIHAAWLKENKRYTITFAQDQIEKVKTTLSFGTEEVDIINAYALGGDVFDQGKQYHEGDWVKYTDALGHSNYYKANQDHIGVWESDHFDLQNAVEANTKDEIDNSNATKYKVFTAPAIPTVGNTAEKMLYLVLADDITNVVPVKIISPEGGFKAGKAYKIVVKINGPEKIEVTATITPWEEVNAPDVEI